MPSRAHKMRCWASWTRLKAESPQTTLYCRESQKQDSLTKKFEKQMAKFTRSIARLRRLRKTWKIRSWRLIPFMNGSRLWNATLEALIWDFIKFRSILTKTALTFWKNYLDLNLKPVIENALRIGSFRDDGSPHLIIAKFLYRSQRRDILRKKKHFKNGISTSRRILSRRIGKRKTTWKRWCSKLKRAVSDPNSAMENWYIDGLLHNN